LRGEVDVWLLADNDIADICNGFVAAVAPYRGCKVQISATELPAMYCCSDYNR
jgi:hypothetical protein